MTLGYVLYIFAVMCSLWFAGIVIFMDYTSLRLKNITPDNVYAATRMNWVSCCVVTGLVHMNPIVLLLKGIYYITHVGRK